jgi:hypothetical protein
MATWTKVVVESSAGNIAQKAATAGTADNITSQGALATLNVVGAAQITDNTVGAAELNVSGNGSSGQILKSDGDGSFSWVADSQVSVDTGISSSSSNPVENHVVYDQLALKENVISASNRVDATNVGTGVITNTEFNYLNGVTSAIQTQFGTKVSTSGNETIAGNKTFSGNTSVANLTVTGTTTTVETETIKLADNVIELNSNATGTPLDSTDVGIVVNRGDSADAYLTWDESEDRWSKSFHNNPTSKSFLQTVVVSSSATAPTADLDGIGMMYMADGVPYIRTV